jgi:uncharacterized Ntn-hydrolase superfamily protein
MTYSIVARDLEAGEFGIAVQTHYFQVGLLVPWARSGVGAVAAQARGPGPHGHGRGQVEVRYGPSGLDLMQAGYTAAQALEALLTIDPFAEWRQVAIVDAQGSVAVHTGPRCVREAGHHFGNEFSAQGNMMASAAVWDVIGETFESTTGPLAERMLHALQAGQAVGGDLRGQQSAAILVMADKPSGQPWRDRRIDIRVEDHSQPLLELKRLLRIKRAYAKLEEAHLALANGNGSLARELRQEVLRLAPEMIELRFWSAVDSAAAGDFEEGVTLLGAVVVEDGRWLEYLRRLPDSNWLARDLVDKLEARVLASRSPNGTS